MAQSGLLGSWPRRSLSPMPCRCQKALWMSLGMCALKMMVSDWQTLQWRESPLWFFRGLSESIIYISRLSHCHVWLHRCHVLGVKPHIMIPRDQFFTMGPWPHKLGFFGSPLMLHRRLTIPLWRCRVTYVMRISRSSRYTCGLVNI